MFKMKWIKKGVLLGITIILIICVCCNVLAEEQDEAENYISEKLSEVEKLLDEQEFEQAQKHLETILRIFPDDDRLLHAQREMEIKSALLEAQTLQQSGQLMEAIAVLQKENVTFAESRDAVELLAEMEIEYREQVVEKARVAYAQEGYSAAGTILYAGLQVLPNEKELLLLLEEYRQNEPVDMLATVKPLVESGAETSKSIADNEGSYYDAYIDGGYQTGKNNYITFHLNEDYSLLSGTVFLKEQKSNTNYGNWITVYGDEQMLYKSGVFSAGSRPEMFQVCVSGVDELRIEFGKNVKGAITSVIGVGELKLTKDGKQ